MWVEDLVDGLLAAGFARTAERGSAELPVEYWCVLARGEVIVKLHHDREAWDIILGHHVTSPSTDRWSNRTTSVHLLRAVQSGTIDIEDAATSNAEADGRWLLCNLDTVDELVGLEQTWRDMYEFDRAYMAARFEVDLPDQPGQ